MGLRVNAFGLEGAHMQKITNDKDCDNFHLKGKAVPSQAQDIDQAKTHQPLRGNYPRYSVDELDGMALYGIGDPHQSLERLLASSERVSWKAQGWRFQVVRQLRKFAHFQYRKLLEFS